MFILKTVKEGAGGISITSIKVLCFRQVSSVC